MYKKEFIPFTEDEIRMVNASALARQFNCTSTYIGRIMKLQEYPKNENAQLIIKAAREIVDTYKSYPDKKKK
ncbi:hypothetical protein [Formosa sp. A9]|uniref:hypothetical protein n=1 Tax=Formosa sp. A9 TaxID=3442641 RepID=UPI003EBFF35F